MPRMQLKEKRVRDRAIRKKLANIGHDRSLNGCRRFLQPVGCICAVGIGNHDNTLAGIHGDEKANATIGNRLGDPRKPALAISNGKDGVHTKQWLHSNTGKDR